MFGDGGPIGMVDAVLRLSANERARSGREDDVFVVAEAAQLVQPTGGGGASMQRAPVDRSRRGEFAIGGASSGNAGVEP